MANSFINKKADLTTTDLTTLYTVPSFKAAVVKSLLVSEDAGSGSTITITLVNSSGAIFNLFKDKAGLGIRSLRGNYAETINKEFDRYDGAVKRAENKYGVKWDGNQFVNADTGEVDENSELATKRNRRNIEMFKFFQNQKIERDNMRRAVIEKMKNQESAPVQKNFPITKTGDGGLSEAEKKAFAPRQDTFTKGKTVTLSDGRQYSSPR